MDYAKCIHIRNNMSKITKEEVKQKPNYIDNKVFYAALLERRNLVDIALLEQVKDNPIEYQRRLTIIENAKDKTITFDKNDKEAKKNSPGKIHFSLYKKSRKSGLKLPQVTNYIGECFLKIATNFSTIQNSKHSYYKYPFRDEMISDAVINCLRYIDSFDVYHGDNPFSFFTTCVYHSFVLRIHKERIELAVKQKIIKNFDFDKVSVQGHDDPEIVNEYIEHIQSYTTGVDYADYFDKKGTILIDNKPVKKERKKYEMKNSLSRFLDE